MQNLPQVFTCLKLHISLSLNDWIHIYQEIRKEKIFLKQYLEYFDKSGSLKILDISKGEHASNFSRILLEKNAWTDFRKL